MASQWYAEGFVFLTSPLVTSRMDIGGPRFTTSPKIELRVFPTLDMIGPKRLTGPRHYMAL